MLALGGACGTQPIIAPVVLVPVLTASVETTPGCVVELGSSVPRGGGSLAPQPTRSRHTAPALAKTRGSEGPRRDTRIDIKLPLGLRQALQRVKFRCSSLARWRSLEFDSKRRH